VRSNDRAFDLNALSKVYESGFDGEINSKPFNPPVKYYENLQ